MCKKGYKFTKEVLLKRVQSRRKNGNYTLSLETKQKISETMKKIGHKPPSALGKKRSKETKIKLSESLKGKKPTYGHLGKKHSIESRQKMSNSLKGRISPNKGRKWPESFKQKIRQTLLNKRETLSVWKGGISYLPYSPEFTNSLKQEIKKRDRYICQICKKMPEILCIHHIDYNKNNSKIENLIALCFSCHSRTNHNRENWIQYFKNKVYEA